MQEREKPPTGGMSLAIGLIILACSLAYVAYTNRVPRGLLFSRETLKPVDEIKQLTISSPQVSAEGQIEYRTKTLTYKNTRLVPEQNLVDLEVDSGIRLRSWLQYGAAIWAAVVACMWVYLTLLGKKRDHRLAKVDKHMSDIAKVVFGVLAGSVAGSPGSDAELARLRAQREPIQQQIAAYAHVLSQQSEQFQSLVAEIQRGTAPLPATSPVVPVEVDPGPGNPQRHR